MIADLLKLRGYTPEFARALHFRSKHEVPPFLYRKLVEYIGCAPEIFDLGCGGVYPESYTLCEGLASVALIDPFAYIREGETGVDLKINPDTIGLPAIAMHPGFALEMHPNWGATLDRLRPPAISFCAFNETEMTAELHFLQAHGYEPITVQTGFREELVLFPGVGSYCDTWSVVKLNC
jgi:hypothetical protein